MPKACILLLAVLALPILCKTTDIEVSLLELIDCSQSSTHADGHCNRATDGNPDGNYNAGSCSHTNHERAWWRARVARLSYFRDIRVYNRQDCCADRLNDFTIKIDGQECARYQSGHHFPDMGFPCNRAGFEITIESNQVAPLTLCEVQALGHTMAPLKFVSCSQSSTDSSGVCQRAYDGNKAQNYDHGSCTHTAYTANEWWEGRIERNALITNVRIYNRQDCCAERLNDFTILVEGQPCASYKSDSAFSDKMFECNSVGQVVRIKNNKVGPLTLCEVEVFGEYK